MDFGLVGLGFSRISQQMVVRTGKSFSNGIGNQVGNVVCFLENDAKFDVELDEQHHLMSVQLILL